MASNPNPDRNTEYMYKMWGTTHLITDYSSNLQDKKVIQEIMHDDIQKNHHNLAEQSIIHKKIRNDEDYDDWEYGTEPTYGSSW
jgi:hypothetical protein